jgi:antitoxin MazE
MKVQIAKWGNSAAIRLPKAVLELLDVRPGSEFEASIEGKTLRLAPVRKRYPTLDELVAEMTRLGPDNEPELDWGPDVGAEIIDDAGSDDTGKSR